MSDLPQSSPSKRPLAKRILKALLTLLVIYCLMCAVMVWLEPRLVYHPPTVLDRTQEGTQLGGREVSISSTDGVLLHAWFFEVKDSQRAVLYLHGNGEDIERNLQQGSTLSEQLHANVLLVDYRGYGHSTGAPHEAGVIQDALAAQRWLADELHLQPQDIILFGRSLGGGVAVAAASELGACALILWSTFANMSDVAASRYPIFPVRWLMQNPFPSEQRIVHYNGPLLQLHGEEDWVVPIALGQPLFAAAPSKLKQFVTIPHQGHNDRLTEETMQIVAEFLDHVDSRDQP